MYPGPLSGPVEVVGGELAGPGLSPVAALVPGAAFSPAEIGRMVAVLSLLYTASSPVPRNNSSRAACFSSCPVTGLAVAWLTTSYRYSSCIFACAAKFLSALGSGCAAMSNRAGSALALPGVARISPDAHANACNTASPTKPLFVLMNSPIYFVLVLRLCMSRLISTTPERQTTPGRFLTTHYLARPSLWTWRWP